MIRKKKPTAPVKPEKPDRRQVYRHREIMTSGASPKPADVITQLQSLPPDSFLRIEVSGGGGCTCCDSYCDSSSEGTLIAEWPEMESDAEYETQLKYHRTNLKRYEADFAKYQKNLEKWEAWYTENKEALEAQERKAKAAEVMRLEKAATEAQKQLETAQKRLKDLKEKEKI